MNTIMALLFSMKRRRKNSQEVLVSVPAGRCRAAPEADCAAPGRVSASGGEAACPCSPAPKPAPAPPAGKLQTPAAPPHSPHPAQSGSHSRK